jgi:hypothetical protein
VPKAFLELLLFIDRSLVPSKKKLMFLDLKKFPNSSQIQEHGNSSSPARPHDIPVVTVASKANLTVRYEI